MNRQNYKICTVGLNCVDIINYVNKFPIEDSDQRCSKQIWERGGNASNNASVLAVLGMDVEFYGTIANDKMLQFYLDDMNSYGISHKNCQIIDNVNSPVSMVISSEDSGSRTIIHSNGTLPDISAEHFQKNIKLEDYSWIHFEGRNIQELVKILKFIQDYNNANSKEIEGTEGKYAANYKFKKLTVSVEIEKARDLSSLIPYANVILAGKDFAKFKGANNLEEGVGIISNLATPGTLVICAWGEQGAAYKIAGNESLPVCKVESYPPGKIVDSLGAGDTFNASVIFALSKGVSIDKAVNFGCRVASEKLGVFGFRDIQKNLPNLLSAII